MYCNIRPAANFRATIAQNLLFWERFFYGQWTGTRMDKMDRMDKNGLLNGQWTRDRDYVAPFRADSNIADLTDPSDPTDPSEKPIDQITNSRAISFVKAATL